MKKPPKLTSKVAGNAFMQLPKCFSDVSSSDTKWQNFKIATRQGMLLLEQSKKNVASAPYDQPVSFLKREIYKLVCQCIDGENRFDLESAIEADRWPHRPGSVAFKENPFHWAFFGFRDPEDKNIGRYQVSRFGRQLLYARRHAIPPELLIGFIFQSDSHDSIYQKANQPETYEDWFLANQKSLKEES